MTDSGWNDRFCAELTARLVAVLAGARSAASLAHAVAESAAAAEASCQGREMACAAGCAYCCVLNVAVLLPEALRIADWLQERLPPEELLALQKILEGHRSWGRWMDDEERIARHVTCPMLDGAGCCIIYPVRPLACRGVTSLDRDRCREAHAPVINDEVPLVPTDLMRRAAYDDGFQALARALQFHGIDNRSIELGTGVLAFLTDPGYRELLFGGTRLPDELWRF